MSLARRLVSGLAPYSLGIGLSETTVYPADAQRMADTVTLMAIAGSAGMWAAFSLSDGRSPDNTPYLSRAEAVMYQRWDRDNYVYILVPPDGMQPKEADAFLRYSRALHKNGFRLPDPENLDKIPTMPLTTQDQRAQIRALIEK
jgi:hypothetical protein